MTYAKVKDNIVINMISLRQAQAHEFPDCVPVYEIPVELGDTYIDGIFYRNGDLVKSAEMRVAELEAELATAAETAAEESLAILRGEVEA